MCFKSGRGLKGLILKFKRILSVLWNGKLEEYIKHQDTKYINNSEDTILNIFYDPGWDMSLAELKWCLSERAWYREKKKYSENTHSYIDNMDLITNDTDININILFWFADKWLSGTSGVEKEKKKQFYLWLEGNYTYHLIKQRDNKEKNFKQKLKRRKKEAIVSGNKKLWQIIARILSSIFGTVTISSVISSFLFQKIDMLKDGREGLIIICLVSALVCLICIICSSNLLINIDYHREKEKVEQKEETWLRHTEVLTNYQRELLDYLWETGKYSISDKLRKDRLLMISVKNIWYDNAMKFQSNMKKNNEKFSSTSENTSCN